MTAPAKTQTETVKVRHEEFCLPREGAQAPRVESYTAVSDDPRSGRSRPTHRVTRCVECGAANYLEIGHGNG